NAHAVVAQLVERHLAKVEVASPSLVYRSNALPKEGRAFHMSFSVPSEIRWFSSRVTPKKRHFPPAGACIRADRGRPVRRAPFVCRRENPCARRSPLPAGSAR